MSADIGRWLTLLFALASAAWGVQKTQTASPRRAEAQPAAMSEEDREILRNRELLENMELLQNFEKIRYLNFLAKKKETKAQEKPASKTPAKGNGNKKDP